MSFRQSAIAEQSRFMSTRASMILAPRPTVLRRDGSGLGTTRRWVMARRAQNDSAIAERWPVASASLMITRW
jgi:hypothetical protein